MGILSFLMMTYSLSRKMDREAPCCGDGNIFNDRLVKEHCLIFTVGFLALEMLLRASRIVVFFLFKFLKY